MLEVIFDRLGGRMMSTSLEILPPITSRFRSITSRAVRFGDYLNSIPLPAMLAVFRAEEWDDYGLMTVDSSLIYSVVDVLLGGRRGTVPLAIEGGPTRRSSTRWSTADAGRPVRSQRRFRPSEPGQFPVRAARDQSPFRRPSRARPTPPFWRVSGSTWKIAADAWSCCCRMRRWSRSRNSSCRCLLARNSATTRSGENHLATELWSTDIEVTAVLDEQLMSLTQIMNIRVGERLMLDAMPDSDVKICCGDIPLFTRKVGRSRGRIAVQIDRKSRADKDN